MSRKLLLVTFGFIAGIFLSRLFSNSSFLWLACIIILVIIVHSLIKRKRAEPTNAILIYVILFFLAFGGIYLLIFDGNHTKELSRFSDKYVTVTAKIKQSVSSTDFNSTGKYENRYIVQMDSLSYLDKTYYISEKLLICLYNCTTADTYQFNDIISLSGFLNIPYEQTSSFGFDEKIYLRTQNIFYKISTLGSNAWFNSHDDSISLDSIANSIKTYGRNLIDARLPKDQARIFKAMVFGDTNSISDEVYGDFKTSGTVHILVVSGMHASILLIPLVFIFSSLNIGKKLRFVLCSCILLLFMLVNGSSPSIVRGVICSLMLLACQNSEFEQDTPTSLAVAAGLICCINPYALYDLSFQLSFLCIFGMAFFNTPLKSTLHWIKNKYVIKTVAATVSSQLLVFPLLIQVFGQISLYSIVANIMLIWMIPVTIFSGFLLVLFGGIPLIYYPISGLCYICGSYLLYCTKWVSSLPFAAVPIPQLPPLYVVLFFLGIYCLWRLLKDKSDKTSILLACVIAIALLISGVSPYFSKNVALTFINVGQGDAALLELPNGQNIIIDGGGSNYAGAFNAGEKIFVPYLQKSGINQIDYAFVSHYDSDHALGVIEAIKSMEVRNLILPYRKESKKKESNHTELLRLALEKNIPVFYFSQGEGINFKDIDARIQVLSPDENLEYLSENDGSMVLKFQYGDISCLFAGDISAEICYNLSIETDPQMDVSCDILKIPHHGSIYSLSGDLIDKTNAQYAVIPVGKNTFGHPSKDVLHELGQNGIKILQTDLNGDIQFIFDDKKIKETIVFMGGLEN